MKIAVLGAGAMGSWFGGELALQGNDVQLLTTNQKHRDTINQRGLRLIHQGVEQSISISARHPNDIEYPVDLVLLFTKTFQSSAAMKSIAHAIDDHTHVLSLQNGLGNAEVITEYVSADRVLVGVTMMPVDTIEPGVVASKGSGTSHFGWAVADRDSRNNVIARRILEAFRPTSTQVEFDSKIHKRIWEKIAFSAGMNALAALAHGTPGSIGKSPGAKDLAYDVAREVATVAHSQGVDVDLRNVFGIIELSCEKHGEHKASMLQDLLAGRFTEVESVNGAIVLLARQSSTAVPLNEVLYTLIKLAELSHQQS